MWNESVDESLHVEFNLFGDITDINISMAMACATQKHRGFASL